MDIFPGASQSVPLSWLVLGFTGTLMSFFAAKAILIRGARLNQRTSWLQQIPSLGPEGLGSYLTCYRLQGKDGYDMLRSAYYEHRNGMFRLPLPSKWMVVVCSNRLIDDLWKAADHELSFSDAIDEQLQLRHTMGPTIVAQNFHVKVLLTTMSRNLSNVFPDMLDEVFMAVDGLLSAASDWDAFPAHKTMLDIVSRVSGRVLVGYPLCRRDDYKSLNIDFARNVIAAAELINCLPSFVRRLAGWAVSPLPGASIEAKKHLTPLIEQRLRQDEELGPDWDGRPNDMISWLIDGVDEPYQLDAEYLTTRFLMINFVSLHTTAQALTQALINLALYPDHVQPLRDEIQTQLSASETGWTREAVDAMVHVDSFLRETLRLCGSLSLTMVRKVVNRNGFTFSDGTVIPPGTLLAVPVRPFHSDEEYSAPDSFDGFRFVPRQRGDPQRLRPLSIPAPDFLAWGNGRHACPGRLFASLQMKTILAHLILHYDVKLEDGKRPVDERTVWRSHVHPSARLFFKKVRQ